MNKDFKYTIDNSVDSEWLQKPANYLFGHVAIFFVTLIEFCGIWITNANNIYEASVFRILILILIFFLILIVAILVIENLPTYTLFFKIPSVFLRFILVCLISAFFLISGSNYHLFFLSLILAICSLCVGQYFLIVSTGLCSLLFVILQMFFYSAGFIRDNVVAGNWIRETNQGLVSRIAFGFGQPNIVFPYILSGWVSIYYMKKSKIRNLFLIICSIVTLVDFAATNTRTMFFPLIFLLLSPLITRTFQSRSVQFLLILAFPLLTFLSWVIAIFFGSEQNPISSFLSYRPTIWHQYINSGLSLLGPSDGTRQLLESNVPFDNYGLYILYTNGLLIFIFFTVAYGFLTYLSFRISNLKLVMMILVFLIFGFSESRVTIISAPFFPLLFVSLFSSETYFKTIENI